MVMPSFGAGLRLPASYLEQMARQIDSLTAPGYTAWSPSWGVVSGTPPALGNGTLTGDYRRPAGADIVRVRFQLQWGSTTTNGIGVYTIGNLPFAPHAATLTKTVGNIYILDSGVLDKIGEIKFESLTALSFVTATAGVVNNTTPQTWANGDILRGDFEYQPA